MILSICNDPKVLEIMRLVNIFINAIRIVVPIILIFVLMIKLMGAITKNDNDALQKVLKIAPKNMIAAALVFLVPFIVRLVVHITAPDSEFEQCITITSTNEISNVYERIMETLVSKAEETKSLNDYNTAYSYLKNIKDEDKRKSYEERLEKVKSQISGSGGSGSSGDSSGSGGDDITPGNFIVDPGTTMGCEKYGKYQWCSPKRGIFGSFAYYDSKPNSTEDRWSMEMDPKWARANFVSISKTCSNGWNLDFKVHKLAKTTWEKVLDKLCQITTSGIDGYKYSSEEIKLSGKTPVVRFTSGTKYVSNHSYGTAIDINPSVSYTVNGKKYTPYNRDVKEYEAFVSALGREDDKRNINYILWKKIFQPLGFNWGGNWGRNGNKSTYDGMHFEIAY